MGTRSRRIGNAPIAARLPSCSSAARRFISSEVDADLLQNPATKDGAVRAEPIERGRLDLRPGQPACTEKRAAIRSYRNERQVRS